MNKLASFIGVVSIMLLSGCTASKINSSANLDRDGSSPEKAIIVSSISEEYEYANKVCNNCSFTQQALVFVKKKPYDILTLEQPNGEMIEYYFDISKFYGKW